MNGSASPSLCVKKIPILPTKRNFAAGFSLSTPFLHCAKSESLHADKSQIAHGLLKLKVIHPNLHPFLRPARGRNAFFAFGIANYPTTSGSAILLQSTKLGTMWSYI